MVDSRAQENGRHGTVVYRKIHLQAARKEVILTEVQVVPVELGPDPQAHGCVFPDGEIERRRHSQRRGIDGLETTPTGTDLDGDGFGVCA